ncbi:hypothetical protein CLOP_g22945 [Closterium sp. NIES-67]|nr:hypothetical protein CLOP_g22945 [Closterium sp. NIES-67]
MLPLLWPSYRSSTCSSRQVDLTILPGFDYNKAVTELWVFTATMVSQYKDDEFQQGLTLTLDNNEWQRSYPNILKLWQALAVLPLSTVECERGFSKQNLIKSWSL